MGTLRVLYSKGRHSARLRAAEVQPPERKQGGNWADPVGLAVGTDGRRATSARQLRSACGLPEKEVWSEGRRRRPSALYPTLLAAR